MPTKLIQAAAITFVLYLVMGMKATGTAQRTSAVIGQTASSQTASTQTSSLSNQVAELVTLYGQSR